MEEMRIDFNVTCNDINDIMLSGTPLFRLYHVSNFVIGGL